MLLASFNIKSQDAYLKGFIFDHETAEPLPFAYVMIKETGSVTLTNDEGFFAFTLKPGTYTLLAFLIGYDTLKEKITLKAGQVVTKRFTLKPASVRLKTVTITTTKQQALQEARTSMFRITPTQIKSLPSIGKQDVIQYLQTLPGVVSTGDVGGQIFIRGGTPVQTLTLLDGVPIFQYQHSLGLFSVFQSDIIRSVTLYTGGFNAEYGGRLSAVLDIKSLEPRKRMTGGIAINPFVSDAWLSLPFNKHGSGIVLGGQLSRLDFIAPKVYSFIDSGNLPYRFADFFGKVTLRSKRGSRVSGFWFNFSDSVGFPDAQYAWKNSGGGVNFIVSPPGTRFLLGGVLGYSGYQASMLVPGAKPSLSSLSSFIAEIYVQYHGAERRLLQYGVAMQGYSSELEFYNLFNQRITYKRNVSELVVYVKARRNWKQKLILEPGLRFHYYATGGYLLPEPRFSMKYNHSEKLRFKGATGIYTQSLFTTVSDAEITQLFVGFLNLPEGTLTFNGKPIRTNVQSAFHAIAGAEWEPVNNVQVNIESFYKKFFRLFSVNRYKMFPTEPDYIVEDGYAAGFDLMVSYKTDRLWTQASYVFTYVIRDDGIREYFPWFDRRHYANVLVSYEAGKAKQWMFSARWMFGSGLPYTPTAGFYPQYDFPGGITDDYVSGTYNVGLILDNKNYNKYRLPPYHRLDVHVEYRFFLSHRATLVSYFSLFNAYNRRNVFYVNRVTGDVVYQLPLIPIVGLKLKFK